MGNPQRTSRLWFALAVTIRWACGWEAKKRDTNWSRRTSTSVSPQINGVGHKLVSSV
jgi:hypothetical protein